MQQHPETKKRSRQAIGMGLGFGLAGAVLLLARYGLRKRPRVVLPESLSPAIFATRVVSTSAGQMVYHTSGSGEPVVFLHGIYPGASSFEWSRVYPHFTAEREVIAADLVGFGESQRPARALPLAEQARALLEFIHLVCGGRQPALVTSGFSAKVALLLAAQHPELPRSVALWMPLGVRRALRGSAARTLLGMGSLFRLPPFVWKSSIASPAFIRAWLARVGFEEDGAEDREAVAALSNCAGLYRADLAISSFLRGGFAADLSSRLGDIICPVSILWPEATVRCSGDEAADLAGELRAGRLVLAPKKGLLAPLRSPAYFQNLIGRELACSEGGLHLA